MGGGEGGGGWGVGVFFFFKQKTAYEIYQCDWSSDVCSSDLKNGYGNGQTTPTPRGYSLRTIWYHIP